MVPRQMIGVQTCGGGADEGMNGTAYELAVGKVESEECDVCKAGATVQAASSLSELALGKVNSDEADTAVLTG